MLHKRVSTFFLILIVIIGSCSFSLLNAKNRNMLHQKNVFSLETLADSIFHEGLAGSFFGKHGSYFVFAGGSGFPLGKPWQGGVKMLTDLVLIFEQSPDGVFNLVYQGKNLPAPTCEGAYASIASGILCIGGLTPDGLTSKVYHISYNGTLLDIVEYPELPTPVKNLTATVIGSVVYVVGGELEDGLSTNQFLSFDTNNPTKGWQKLPDFPVHISGSTLTSQQDGEEFSLYAFGGRAKHGGITKFYSSVYQYRPSKGEWIKNRDIQLMDGQSISVAMATASSVGGSHILLYGGDTGLIFNQVENAISNHQFQQRDSLWINHAGFNSKILIYNTITDTWFEAGETKNKPVAVTADVSDGENVYIASGEIQPGIRSPYITQLYYTSKTNFGWLNYLVLFIYFGGMLFLGFFFMKRNENTEDFFKASGRIPWWAAGISIFATSLSAITFLSIPAKTYASDWRMLVFNISIILIVPIVIKYFMPFFRRFNFGTAYQYLEVRFSRVVRWLASTLFLFFMVSRIAVVLFLPSLALNAVTGFNIYYSIILMGIVTIIYSTSGGMEAVVWGDVVQGFILVFGAIAAFLFMVIGLEGGFSEFWGTSIEYHKFRTFDFRFDFSQPVFWVVLIGGVANSLITYTSDQSIVQRYMSTKDEKATANSIWLNGILSVPVTLLFFIIGTGLFVFYSHNPENMSITNANIDSVFPQFIVSEMPSGLAGLLIAAIFAAAMSTLSSNINSSAAVITSDFFQTINPKGSHKFNLNVARWSGIVCGLLGMGMALILATWNIASLWDQFNTFLGLLTSGLGALFILGIFFPRVGSKAAIVGVIGGLIMLLFIKNNTSLSFLLYGFLGMVASILVSWLTSFLLPNKKEISRYTWKMVLKNYKI